MQEYRAKVIQCTDWLRENPNAEDQEKRKVNARLKAYTFLSENNEEVCYELLNSPLFGSVVKGYMLMLIDSVDMAKRTRGSLVSQLEECLTENSPAEAKKYYDEYYD